MDETRFQNLIHEAIGEEPMPQWLPAQVRARLLKPRARVMPGRVLIAIAVLVVVLGAGVVEAQILFRKSTLVPLPAATPSPTALPSPLAVDPSNCLLPVVVDRGSGPPTKLASEVGFVDTKTGRYTRDDSGTVVGLPGFGPTGTSAKPGPGYYSAAARRWLPVTQQEVAPDGRSYAWVQILPVGSAYPNYKSSELHRYDIDSGTDHLLWTYQGAIGIVWWGSSGIVVDAGPVRTNAPARAWFLIDPVTGAAARYTPPWGLGFTPFKPLPGDPHNARFTTLGSDAEGHTIWWIYDLDRPGSVSWVFYETAPGKRVTIYRGTERDATGFDPTGGALADATGIWFADNERHAIWHWQHGVGLRKVRITGLPAVLSGLNSYVQVAPAGPCF